MLQYFFASEAPKASFEASGFSSFTFYMYIVVCFFHPKLRTETIRRKSENRATWEEVDTRREHHNEPPLRSPDNAAPRVLFCRQHRKPPSSLKAKPLTTTLATFARLCADFYKVHCVLDPHLWGFHGASWAVTLSCTSKNSTQQCQRLVVQS